MERASPELRSNSVPASSKRRVFESASTSSAMFEAVSSWAIGFIDEGVAWQNGGVLERTTLRVARPNTPPCCGRGIDVCVGSAGRRAAVGTERFGVATMIGELLLVLLHLPIKLVGERVDRRIHLWI